jgi:hypothetical protein
MEIARAMRRANGRAAGKPRILRDIIEAFRRPQRFARCRFACAAGTAASQGFRTAHGFQTGRMAFRPGRSPHTALAALDRALMTRKVNWVLDVDIRNFFDSVDHGWLLRMLAHRIADPRILRLIERWVKAGILESGRWQALDKGTPQGSGITTAITA